MAKRGKYFRGFILAMCMALLLPFFGRVTAEGETSQAAKVEIPYRELGDYLTGTATSPSERYPAANIYNNSGMSGNDGITHRHTNSNPAAKMWSSKSNDIINTYVIIELNFVNQLGLMLVWNYNEQGKTENGIRNAVIWYSVDGQNYTRFGDVELARASGEDGIRTTNLQGSGQPINLGGVTAKFIKIVPKVNGGNWGGQYYGLSEVKIYEYRPTAKKNGYIKASPYHATDMSRVAANFVMVNGQGMSHYTSNTATHDNDPANMYKAKTTSLIFDLKGSYPISNMYIWNYNDPEHLDYGVKEIEISYTVNANKSYEFWDKLGTFEVKKASGKAAEPYSAKIPFENAMARFVRVTFKKSHGGDYYGLSAVRFYCGEGIFIEAANEWTSVLSNYNGFAGGDGFFSVSLTGREYAGIETRDEGHKAFFVFSDTTVIYNVDEVNRTTNQGVIMPNNSFAVFEGKDPFNGSVTFMYNNETSGSNKVPLRPRSDREGTGARYWQGAPVVLNGKVYVTPHYVESAPYGMGFEQTGCDIASFNIVNDSVNFDSYQLFEDTYSQYMSAFRWPNDIKRSGPYTSAIFFNAGFLVNTAEAGAPNPDGYVYNYGYYDMEGAGKGRYLVVARCTPEDISDFTKLEYFDGEGWSNNIWDVEPLCSNVSTELSVTPITFGPYAGKYMVVYQAGTITQLVAARIADTPWGPFGEEIPLYFSIEPNLINARIKQNNPTAKADAYCYNAKAHPALSRSGELLISYNMNYFGSGWTGIQNNVDCYHPRFIRLSVVTEQGDDEKVDEGINDDDNIERKGCKSSAAAALPLGALLAAATMFKKKRSK